MRAVTSRWTSAIAVLVFSGGICAAAWGSALLNRRMTDIERAQALLNRLKALEARLDSIEEAKEHLDTLETSSPVDLDLIIKDAGLTETVADSESGVSSLDDGWSVITRQIVLSDVILTELDDFAVMCHQARPPWVLTEVSLKSSPFESGRAKATVTLEALRRKSQ